MPAEMRWRVKPADKHQFGLGLPGVLFPILPLSGQTQLTSACHSSPSPGRAMQAQETRVMVSAVRQPALNSQNLGPHSCRMG